MLGYDVEVDPKSIEGAVVVVLLYDFGAFRIFLIF